MMRVVHVDLIVRSTQVMTSLHNVTFVSSWRVVRVGVVVTVVTVESGGSNVPVVTAIPVMTIVLPFPPYWRGEMKPDRVQTCRRVGRTCRRSAT